MAVNTASRMLLAFMGSEARGQMEDPIPILFPSLAPAHTGRGF